MLPNLRLRGAHAMVNATSHTIRNIHQPPKV
jgi:hypothetical protein